MKVAQSVSRGERIVLGMQNAQGCLSVPSNSLSINPKINLIVLMSPNCWFTPQRDAVAGRELMNELESCARQQGKTVLVLDTATGSGAELFYHNCGWKR